MNGWGCCTEQVGSPALPLRVHVPMTTPLLSVPVVVVVPLDVPVRFPVSVRVLPGGVTDVIVKFNVPVTWFAEPVTSVALPVSLEPGVSIDPIAKHFPALIKPKPLISRGPELVTEKVVTKLSRLAWSIPPVS
jgi:hypothetical protein